MVCVIEQNKSKKKHCYFLNKINSFFFTEINIPKKQQSAVDQPVDLKEVITVLNGIYGGSQNIEKEESTFPLQQKLLLCSLLLILNKGRNKDVTVGKVSVQ